MSISFSAQASHMLPTFNKSIAIVLMIRAWCHKFCKHITFAVAGQFKFINASEKESITSEHCSVMFSFYSYAMVAMRCNAFLQRIQLKHSIFIKPYHMAEILELSSDHLVRWKALKVIQLNALLVRSMFSPPILRGNWVGMVQCDQSYSLDHTTSTDVKLHKLRYI